MKTKTQKQYKVTKPNQVKIQGKWLRADPIIQYDSGQVWYTLEGATGSGSVDPKYKVKCR